MRSRSREASTALMVRGRTGQEEGSLTSKTRIRLPKLRIRPNLAEFPMMNAREMRVHGAVLCFELDTNLTTAIRYTNKAHKLLFKQPPQFLPRF